MNVMVSFYRDKYFRDHTVPIIREKMKRKGNH